MGYIIEGAGLTVLGWIAYSLYRLVRFIQHEHAVAECSPDSEYPAFPRRQIQAAVEQLDEHKLKSHLENEQWAALDEDKRRDVVQEAAYLGGHLKTGQTWPLQNRPTKLSQNKSIYNPPMAVSANLFSQSVPKSLY